MLEHDERFAEAYAGASLRLADGVPLLWAAKLKRPPLRAKISGSDLLPLLCERAAQAGLSVYFLGGRERASG